MEGTYVVRFGDYVKIGKSSSVKHRLLDIPHDSVVGIIPDMRAEKLLHLLNKPHNLKLLSGHREWYHWTPELEIQVQSLIFLDWSKVNDPMDLLEEQMSGYLLVVV